MGCVGSKTLQSTVSLPTIHTSENGHVSNQSLGNFFHVSTANSRGKKITATLEVTDSELILHRPRHAPIRWPLHFLRRYGYEDGVFSFESGRRCSSGPGVFTFGCAAAEELFQLVQSRVQDNASTQFSSGMVPIILRERSSSANNSIHPSPVHRATENGYLQPNSALFKQRPSSTVPPNDVQDTVVEEESNHAIVDIGLPLRRPASIDITNNEQFSPQHAYINVGVPARPLRKPLTMRNNSVDATPTRLVRCVLSPRQAQSSLEFSPDVPPYVNWSVIEENGRNASPYLDYVQLNMGSPSRPSFRWISHSQSLNRNELPRSSYASIDFAKTKAIRQIVRTPFDFSPANTPRRPTRPDIGPVPQ